MAQINKDIGGAVGAAQAVGSAARAVPNVAASAVPSNAKELVVVCMVFTAMFAAFDQFLKGQNEEELKAQLLKVAIGSGFIVVVLLFLADFEPTIAGSLAALVLVSTIFAIGPNPFDAFGKSYQGLSDSLNKLSNYSGGSTVKSTTSV